MAAKSPPPHLAALLRLLYRGLVKDLYERLAGLGYELQAAHSNVFPYLRDGPSHSTELAERAQVTKQSMGYLLDGLEQKGFVERTPDDKDGRAKLVRLTAKGEAAERAAAEIIERIELEWAEKLGAERFADVKRDLEEMEAYLREDGEPDKV